MKRNFRNIQILRAIRKAVADTRSATRSEIEQACYEACFNLGVCLIPQTGEGEAPEYSEEQIMLFALISREINL